MTVRDSCYSRLRELGVSVEVADEKAPILAGLTERQREAVFLTIQGYSEREIAKEFHIARLTTERAKMACRPKCE